MERNQEIYNNEKKMIEEELKNLQKYIKKNELNIS